MELSISTHQFPKSEESPLQHHHFLCEPTLWNHPALQPLGFLNRNEPVQMHDGILYRRTSTKNDFFWCEATPWNHLERHLSRDAKRDKTQCECTKALCSLQAYVGPQKWKMSLAKPILLMQVDSVKPPRASTLRGHTPGQNTVWMHDGTLYNHASTSHKWRMSSAKLLLLMRTDPVKSSRASFW